MKPTFLIRKASFCTIDELLPIITQGKHLRERGPGPKPADSEVITMELVATYLGLSQDKDVFTYFRCHYAHFFPAMAQVECRAGPGALSHRFGLRATD